MVVGTIFLGIDQTYNLEAEDPANFWRIARYDFCAYLSIRRLWSGAGQ